MSPLKLLLLLNGEVAGVTAGGEEVPTSTSYWLDESGDVWTDENAEEWSDE